MKDDLRFWEEVKLGLRPYPDDTPTQSQVEHKRNEIQRRRTAAKAARKARKEGRRR